MIHKWWSANYVGTPAEHALEPFVAAMGHVYRTQFPYFIWGVRYFPDFLWPTLGVILEVDDESHDEPERAAHDAKRTALLESLGWRVVRCTNEEALHHPHDVIARVLDLIEKRGAVDMRPQLGRPSFSRKKGKKKAAKAKPARPVKGRRK